MDKVSLGLIHHYEFCFVQDFWLISQATKKANYSGPISYENLYPYINFEYKNFSERFREAKILIPRFSIPESKC